jgi:NAD(P)-dependent dehydrogenase (short-subunit alcohol dehydrogenase family)
MILPMSWLDGRVVIITGGARGIGREHALFFASQGARVVVNDVGAGPDGSDVDSRSVDPAAEVVEEIKDLGGEAVASSDDVSDWESGRRLIRSAVETFGGLDALVNNAAILRDRLLVNMTEDEWDSVIRVDLKGHFVPLRHAAEYWRDQARAGTPRQAAVVNTSSTSGLLGNPGQTNYGAAKAGVAALTVIAAQELSRFGVRVNAIAPAARTRLTEATPGLGDIVAAPDDPSRFDEWDPANVSPLVAWLASTACTVTGQVFHTFGGTIAPMTGWRRRPGVERPERWTVDAIAEELPPLL